MGLPVKDFGEGRTIVKTGVQEQEIILSEALDQLANEFMFRGADLAVDETQGGVANQIKQATKLDGNSAQSLLTPMSAETLPERRRFGQSERGFVASQQAQAIPTAAVRRGFLQPRYQSAV